MNDNEITAAIIEIEKAERDRLARESMQGEHTFEVNGQDVTMTEHDWFLLFSKVTVGCKWATQVMTWADMERVLAEHVGFSDATYELLADPAERRRVLFDEGIANMDQWRCPDETWKVTQLAAQVLFEMGYFENPVEMLQWLMHAEGAPLEVVQQLGVALHDLTDDDEEGGE